MTYSEYSQLLHGEELDRVKAILGRLAKPSVEFYRERYPNTSFYSPDIGTLLLTTPLQFVYARPLPKSHFLLVCGEGISQPSVWHYDEEHSGVYDGSFAADVFTEEEVDILDRFSRTVESEWLKVKNGR